MLTPKNARSRSVTKLCLALESFRRTDEGRVRDAKSFLGFYLPYEAGKDRLFVHVPKEVRADLLSNWGVRGKKSALRDDDEKVRTTIADALAAGDIDAAVIESGVTPEVLIDWAPLDEWWSFWRGTALPTGAIRKALATARELELFDEKWFFQNLALKSQKLEGTDVVCAALSKEQVTAWLLAIHGSEDASPAGLLRAVGWDTVLGKTAHEALLFALDALAVQVGLAGANGSAPRPLSPDDVTPRPPSLAPSTASLPPTAPSTASLPPTAPKPTPPRSEPAPPPPGPKTEPAPAPTAAVAAKVTAPIVAPVAAAPIAKPPASSPAVAKPASSPSVTKAAIPAVTVTVAKPPAVPSRPPPVPVVPKPVESAPPSSPLTARALFGAPQGAPATTKGPSGGPGPMRPKALTLAGVGGELPMFGDPLDPPDPTPPSAPGVAAPTFAVPHVVTADASGDEPAWAPPRAEPGDMGWDLVHGIQRPLTTNVQPKYNFDDDDEPTSEIALPGDPHHRA